MNESQQKFFDYFMREHDLITLESDFHEVNSIMKEHYMEIIMKAFYTGDIGPSWEQFKKDNEL